jgi:hypothetical protein
MGEALGGGLTFVPSSLTWSAGMTTTISKVLTVLVTALSLAFLGAAAVSSVARTDWKLKANEYPRNKTQELQGKIDLLKAEADNYAQQTPLVVAAIDTDQKSMIAKAEVLKAFSVQQESEDKKLRQQNDATAVAAQGKLDVDKARREEVVRLQAQFEELLSQRLAAEAEVARLRDLLNQSRGVLERAARRNQSLKVSLGRRDSKAYDPAVDEDSLPPARPRSDGGSAVPGAVRSVPLPNGAPDDMSDPQSETEEESETDSVEVDMLDEERREDPVEEGDPAEDRMDEDLEESEPAAEARDA